MINYIELKRLAETFPADLDWDGNTEPFFNGPSGESLGGGATGFYAVYGQPFRIEGDDYEYEGQTYVEACTADFAKFMVSARDGVLALIAEIERQSAQFQEWQASHHRNYCAAADERDELKAEVKTLRKDLESHKRMLLQAAVDIGGIGEALGAEMDDDASELAGIAADLRKDSDRLSWLDSRYRHVTDGHTCSDPEGEVVAYEWGVQGQCSTVREAIDAAMGEEAGHD